MRKSVYVGLLAVLMIGVFALADVPTPAGDVVLTVSGTIALRNADDVFQFDMDMLQELTGEEYEVTDPWLGPQAYAGVRLKTILEFVGIPAGASSAVIVASDEAEFTVDIEHVFEYPIMFAFSANEESIPSSLGGPLKLVYPYYIENMEELYPDSMWAWWVVEIRVEY